MPSKVPARFRNSRPSVAALVFITVTIETSVSQSRAPQTTRDLSGISWDFRDTVLHFPEPAARQLRWASDEQARLCVSICSGLWVLPVLHVCNYRQDPSAHLVLDIVRDPSLKPHFPTPPFSTLAEGCPVIARRTHKT